MNLKTFGRCEVLTIMKTLLDVLSDRETQKILIKLAINQQITISELKEYGINFESILFTLDYLLDQGILTKKGNTTFIVATNQKAECLVKAYEEMIREDIAKQFFEIERFLKNKDLGKRQFDAFLDDFDNLLKIYKPLIDHEYSDRLKKIVLKIKERSKEYTR